MDIPVTLQEENSFRYDDQASAELLCLVFQRCLHGMGFCCAALSSLPQIPYYLLRINCIKATVGRF